MKVQREFEYANSMLVMVFSFSYLMRFIVGFTTEYMCLCTLAVHTKIDWFRRVLTYCSIIVFFPLLIELERIVEMGFRKSIWKSAINFFIWIWFRLKQTLTFNHIKWMKHIDNTKWIRNSTNCHEIDSVEGFFFVVVICEFTYTQ